MRFSYLFLILFFLPLTAFAVDSSYDPLDDPECNGDDSTRYDINQPMHFFHDNVEKCLGNAVSFPLRAVGIITADTPNEFQKYLSKDENPGVIEFTSPGGNLLAAMQLGEVIRKHQLYTSLGEVCASACAYAFMGGAKRYAITDTSQIPDYFSARLDGRFIGPSGNKFGVHQFYQRETISNLNAVTFTGKDRLDDQVTMGAVIDYTIKMGVDPQVVIMASQVSPDQTRWLTYQERVKYRVDNTSIHSSEINIYPFGKDGTFAQITNEIQGEKNSIRFYCKTNVNTPLISLTFEDGVFFEAKSALDYLDHMTANINFEQNDAREMPIKIVETGTTIIDGKKTVIVALAVDGLTKKLVEAISEIDFSGDLGRGLASFQDKVQFRVRGDKRYLGIAMRNCIR